MTGSENGTSKVKRAPRSPGPRVGDVDTRSEILAAALDLFSAQGYEATSMRAVATKAHVDPALVRHFFKDKDTLFAHALADNSEIERRIVAALAGDRSSLGARLADTYLGLWEDEVIAPILLGLAKSVATSQVAARLFIEIMGARVQPNIDIPLPPLSVATGFALSGTHLFGTAFGRYVLKIPALAEPSREDIVALVAPTIQRYLELR